MSAQLGCGRLPAAGLALVVGLACGHVEAQVVIECPGKLQVTQQGTGLQPPWVADDLSQDGSHRLVNAGVFEGAPTKRRALRPQDTEGQPNSKRYVQRFSWTTTPVEGVFLICHYEGTSVVSFRRIEPTPRHCDLETGRSKQGLAMAVITCR
mgnify:CR=1 FL=1